MALPRKLDTCAVRGVDGLLTFIAGTISLLRWPQAAGHPTSHLEGWRCRLIVVGVLCLLGAADGQALADPKCPDSQPSVSASFDFVESTKQKSFKLNTCMTTVYGPAWADILLKPENFLECKGAPIAQGP